MEYEYEWNIYGISMEYQWNTYGTSMEYLWDVNGIPLEDLWARVLWGCFLSRPPGRTWVLRDTSFLHPEPGGA